MNNSKEDLSLKRVECYICGKNCPTSSIKSHLRSHTHVSVYDCEECGDRFASKRTLDQHRIAHKSHFVCVTCNKKFEDADHLKPHICFEKVKERKHVCDICTKGFYTKFDLRRHIRSHTNEKPYKCDVCDKAFTQRSNRDLHYRTHKKENERNNPDASGKSQKVETEKPWICAICFRAFGYRQHLNRHLRVHTKEKPYVCSVCNKGFSQNTYLKVHIRLHSNERPFKCDKCDKSFPCKWKLTEHIKRHKGPRVFCSVCNKGFFTASDCDKHYLVHSGKKYTCDICHKSFYQLTYLETHYLKHANLKKRKSMGTSKKKFTSGAENSVAAMNSQECTMLRKNKISLQKSISNKVTTMKTEKGISDVIEIDQGELSIMKEINNPFENLLITFQESTYPIEKEASTVDLMSDCIKADLLLISNEMAEEKSTVGGENEKLNESIEGASKNFIQVIESNLVCGNDIKSNINSHLCNELDEFDGKNMIHTNYTLQNLFMCKVCKKMFYSKEDLSSHCNEFMQKNNYKCCLCEQAYNNKKWLIDHHKIHNFSVTKKPFVTFLSVKQ